MHATIILKPLDFDVNAQDEMYVQLQSETNTYSKELCTEGKYITFIQFLQELHVTYEENIFALYSTLK